MSQFIIRAGRSVAAAALFGAVLAAAPLAASHAQQVDPSAQTRPTHAVIHAKHMADHSEARITELHNKLHITAAQEDLWTAVAEAIRENGKAMQSSLSDRQSRLKTMTAIDDLKSFEVIADQHAEGLKKLIPAFEALYASMTPEQQKHADHVFGEHQRHAHL
jgi:hypothetical protein